MDAAYLSGWDSSTFAHNHCSIYYWLASRFLVISFFSLRQLTQQELSITVTFLRACNVARVTSANAFETPFSVLLS